MTPSTIIPGKTRIGWIVYFGEKNKAFYANGGAR